MWNKFIKISIFKKIRELTKIVKNNDKNSLIWKKKGNNYYWIINYMILKNLE